MPSPALLELRSLIRDPDIGSRIERLRTREEIFVNRVSAAAYISGLEKLSITSKDAIADLHAERAKHALRILGDKAAEAAVRSARQVGNILRDEYGYIYSIWLLDTRENDVRAGVRDGNFP